MFPRKPTVQNHPFFGFNRSNGLFTCIHLCFLFIYIFLSIEPCCGQPAKNTRIIGPTVVHTPRILTYELSDSEQFTIRWLVNRSPNITINGANNRQQVNVGFIGKGIDTLVAECTALQTPFEKKYDTLIIHKNECPAIAGNWVNNRPRTCAGQVIELALDSLVGDSIHWQYSENPRLFWVQERTIHFPKNFNYSSPVLNASRFYRAIVQTGNCRDTTATVFVRVDLTPKGSFRMTFNRSICAGSRTPNLGATTSLGVGAWQTNGKGIFSSLNNPNAVYHSSPDDTGKVWLAWIVRNAGCPPARYTDTLLMRIPPRGGVSNNRINLCPSVASQPLGAFADLGVGTWLPPGNSLGKYANPNDPNTTFKAHFSDRNKEINLRWRVSHQNCDSIYTITATVSDASVAKIIFPAKNERVTVCPSVGIRLQADTTGRIGTYQWISNQTILEGQFTATPLVQIASQESDSGIFYLAFQDLQTGCRTLDTTMLYVRKEKPVFQGINDTICFDSGIRLHVFGMDSMKAVRWNPTVLLNDPNLPRPTFKPERSDTTYTFSVEGFAKNIDCPATTTVSIYVKPAINAIVVDPNNRKPNKFCTNYPNFVRIANRNQCKSWAWFGQKKETVLQNGLPNRLNQHYLSQDTILSIQNLPPKDSLYRYCVACYHEATGCTSLTDFSFEVLPVPKAHFIHEKTVPYTRRNVHFQNNSVGGFNFSWDFGDPQSGNNNNSQVDNPNHFFSSAGKYVITLVADNNACSKSFSDTVRVLEEEYYFPNAFTPNNDGKNNIFRPIPAFWESGDEKSIGEIKVQTFEIFTVSGIRVYHLEQPDDWHKQPGWTGNFKDNTPAEPGTYLYKVSILQEPRGLVTHTGYVTLIR